MGVVRGGQNGATTDAFLLVIEHSVATQMGMIANVSAVYIGSRGGVRTMSMSLLGLFFGQSTSVGTYSMMAFDFEMATLQLASESTVATGGSCATSMSVQFSEP